MDEAKKSDDPIANPRKALEIIFQEMIYYKANNPYPVAIFYFDLLEKLANECNNIQVANLKEIFWFDDNWLVELENPKSNNIVAIQDLLKEKMHQKVSF